MVNWFIQEDYGADDFNDAERRETLEEGYLVQEEKIGDVQDPDYTMLRVEDGESGELVAAVTYKGDGGGLDVAEYEGELLDETEGFEYGNPVRLLNGKEILADGRGLEEDEEEGLKPLF